MDSDNNKNLILAIVLSGLVMLVWLTFFPPATPTVPEPGTVATDASGAPIAVTPPPAAEVPAAAAPASETAEALKNAPRVTIDTARLQGALSLLGGRIDTLALKDYRETLDPESPPVTLLSPVGTEHAYYAVYGWGPAGDLPADAVPDATTLYTLESGDTLTETTPVRMKWDNGQGLIFHRTISVDDNFMFTVEQSVENTGTTPVRLFPYAQVFRKGKPEGRAVYVRHEGVISLADGKLDEIKYAKMPKEDPLEGAVGKKYEATENGWIGFTDAYWMTTLIPNMGQAFTSVAKYTPAADTYQVDARMPVTEVAPGATVSSTSRLFAGAKEWDTIRNYQNKDGVYHFIDSIDWGWFFFLTKPIFFVLHWLHGFIGNMGWSIIALTVVLKALVLPLAYKSYVSMARMKELQPQMEELKKKFGDDRAALQQGTMKLYRDNKVNPAAGCLPILIQIPIFFSLYKVIFVTIELRHAPWIGWIRDLSAPDPSSILNLFGLLPYAAPDPGSMLHIISLGILPIFLGISMWLQQKLNPAPTDPTQQMIFAWMPWVFMFMLGSFASGLVLYWITNNTITFVQQYLIMRSHGHKPDVFGNIKASLTRKKPVPVPEKAANSAKKPSRKK
ncbi:membrane protein insertase YidC [Frigidibacter sp. ROC022]|uniref:membrane protein insertase YidC n=1 Tax=Frigidibacter sp. ROC022 TaxID=2971796 RepID=UPI00215A310A|nr:membrane protein insertase YidC [Frigidibacter sp. ROC022]MCR8725919.1 membrane protein insertase YidC [Frigidibacter sp. ROC022]